jgi:DNA-binding ferritin-like protein
MISHAQLRRRLRNGVYTADPKGVVRRLLKAGVDPLEIEETLSDLAHVALNEGDYDAYLTVLQTARPNPQARENFLGFFKSAPPEQVFDLAAHAQTAEGLARRAPRVEHYLVHAPGRNGRGRAWYWLSSLGLRGFEDAKAHGAPVSYISSSSPWNQVRSNIGMYRGGDRIPFVVIDTFSETVEGPLTLAQIQARQNPRSLARRNGATGVAVAVAENLMQQLQGLKVASQIAHWNARGPQGYSDHLLYERIYEKIDKQIDTLAEKYVAYFQRPVPAQAMMPPQDFALWYGEESITPESLAQHVNNARALSDALRSAVNEAGRYQDVQGSVAGFDDYLMSLNNKLDTFYYLLTSVRGA